MTRFPMTGLRALAATVLMATASVAAAQAQDYPNKPVRIVVPYPPGGTTDIITRVLAKGMSETWKQPVLVENRGGASGIIGTEVVAKSPGDGYTLLSTGSGPHVVNVSLFPKIPYDPIKDFEPVGMVISIPLLMVAPANAPYSTVTEFIAWAKQNKGKANYCSIGAGSPSHLAAELFRGMAGIELTHIPHKGSGPAIVDTIGGTCPILFDSAVSSGPQARAGKLKVLAIGTSERVPSWPNVPTVAESGVPGFNAYTWGAMLAPAGTPKAIVDKVNAEMMRILATPEVREMLAAQGATPGKGSPQDLARFANEEIAKWAKVIKDGNIKAE
jgi:tripartite-type tricarboxylate transporter receptor subunit TctC